MLSLIKLDNLMLVNNNLMKEKNSFLSFYRGFSMTLIGMIPYSGLSFSSFDQIKKLILNHKIRFLSTQANTQDNSELTVIGRLTSGACTGMITQTIVYPMDVIRSHMQLYSMLKDPAIKE